MVEIFRRVAKGFRLDSTNLKTTGCRTGSCTDSRFHLQATGQGATARPPSASTTGVWCHLDSRLRERVDGVFCGHPPSLKPRRGHDRADHSVALRRSKSLPAAALAAGMVPMTMLVGLPPVIVKNANRILITADGGGSNGSRLRLWKLELQKLADQTGLAISVCHFPPGTSKWNKVEHRLFSFISSHWRGQPLEDYETIVRLKSSLMDNIEL